jgi:hypothetical protein
MAEIINMILIDTCIWLDYLNKNKSKETDILDLFLEENKICITDIIKSEIISGAKNENEYFKLYDLLSNLPKLEPNYNFWDKLSYTRFQLQKQGYSIAIPDLMIAMLAYQHKTPLFTKDKHFKQIQKILDFELFNT